jgi:hypothetical protein
MKKAFDANVSKTRPRLRLGALVSEPGLAEAAPMEQANVEAIALQVAREEVEAPAEDLGSVLKARAAARAQRFTAAEALEQALEQPAPAAPVAVVAPPAAPVVAHAEAPPSVIEVQTAPLPAPHAPEPDPLQRRERLKDRLRAVRENPRPEPLPDTVAEAGVLAVERISLLQTELTKARALNLALTQDLEATRRQAERATEEARSRMDEARRLATESESRAALLSELEQELRSLEGERNDALLALQDSRRQADATVREAGELRATLAKKDQEIDECLAEEERLAAELESAQDDIGALRRSTEVLHAERDTLARQVSELTRERAELLEARKALEAVHRALSSAVVRA